MQRGKAEVEKRENSGGVTHYGSMILGQRQNGAI